VRPEELGKLNKFIHLIGSRTHDLPACSIAPYYYVVQGRCNSTPNMSHLHFAFLFAFHTAVGVSLFWGYQTHGKLSGRMEWAEAVARLGKKRNAY
jgi:hypothetical protein